MPRKTTIISQLSSFAGAGAVPPHICADLARHVSGNDCLHYMPDFLSPIQADRLFDTALKELPWQRESLHMFGRQVQVPRHVAWQGDPGLCYRYSGMDHHADGWRSEFAALREQLQSSSGRRFNFLLANHYQHGDDYMGWHRDDEAGLASLVASISLGACRRFLVRGQGDSRSRRLDLSHGSLLIFDGAMRHSLPRCAYAEPRINLTFRLLEGGAVSD